MKQTAERVFRKTLAALDASAALAKHMDREGLRLEACGALCDLRDYREIVAIAFGKAAHAMARGLSDILAPEFSVDGILVVPAPAEGSRAEPREPLPPLPGWKTIAAGHPVPDAASFAAGRAILDRLARCDDRTLVFFLLSGGGSSLVEQPLDPAMTLDDFAQLHAALVTCGAPISEINTVRKHLSATKGGRLAAAAPRSMKLTLAISDVPPGEESSLASGPTLPDPGTIQDADRVVRECGVFEKLPPRIRTVFETHALHETPKEGDPAFSRARFALALGQHDLTHAAHRALEGAGCTCVCDNSTDGWPIERAADYLLDQLQKQSAANAGAPAAVICGGEVSSPVTGAGIGGRNSAFVLACVPRIAGKQVAVLSAGTDGIDGNSPAAGAMADGETLARARSSGLDPADFASRSDAYNFFARLGDAILTGHTGNNLRDLRILLTRI